MKENKTIIQPGLSLTSLGDVNEAQQVHQFEEHDDQTHDAHRLQALCLPPDTHPALVF